MSVDVWIREMAGLCRRRDEWRCVYYDGDVRRIRGSMAECERKMKKKNEKKREKKREKKNYQ